MNSPRTPPLALALIGIGVLLVLTAAWLSSQGPESGQAGPGLQPSFQQPDKPRSERTRPSLKLEPVGEATPTDVSPLASGRVAELPVEIPEEPVAEAETEKEPRLFGIVVDATTQRPIEGAEVVMNGFERHTATSNEEGRFEIECEGGKLFGISVEKAGYLTDVFGGFLETRSRVGDAYVFPLQVSGRIEGTVSFPDGKPVTSGRVLVMNSHSPLAPSHERLKASEARDPWSGAIEGAIRGSRPPNFHLGLAPSTNIDKNGHFSLESLPGACFGGPESLRIVVDSGEAIRTSSEPFSVSSGQTKIINIEVDRASRIEGVLDFPPGTDPSHTRLWFCWHESHMDQLGGEGSGRSQVDRVVPVTPHGAFDSGPLWPVKRLKILAVFPLEGQPRGGAPLIFDWELELPEDEVLRVGLTPGNDVQRIDE